MRWYDGGGWEALGSSEGYQRYVKVQLLGGKENPDKLPTPKIKLTSAPKNLYVKQTKTITPSFKNSYDHKVTYTSSNTKVAKINSKGKITALRNGKTTITVSNSETKTSFTLTVKNPKLNKNTVSLKKCKSFVLKVTGKVGKATFKTSNKKIAVVSKGGKITAKKSGKATITVKSNGVTLRCKVTVK